jgi:Spherulation-specific family 4
MRTSVRPAILAGAGVLAVVAATAITLSVGGGKAGGSGTASPTSTTVCERLAVPAYFSAADWETVIHSTPTPADIILNPATGVGAGSAVNRQLLPLVKQAQAAGITVLGYSSTAGGGRPASAVEADVRNYAAWYGVHSIFLDRVSGQPAELSYYKKLAAYIHQAYRGAQVWLNPGDYPDQSYMSIGDVVLVFEGTYKQYLVAQVPGWVGQYPAAKFAQDIFDTPRDVLLNTLKTARQRRAGHIYVTQLTGANPYQELPSYWAAENAEATADCTGSG